MALQRSRLHFLHRPTDAALTALILGSVLVSCVVARQAPNGMTSFREHTTFRDRSKDSIMAQWLLSGAATLLLAQWWKWSSSSTKEKDDGNTAANTEPELVSTQSRVRYESKNFPHDTSKWIWREDGGKSKLVPLHPKPSKMSEADLPKYTVNEVAQHASPTDAWIIIDERVYDISNFIAKHPGGEKVLINMAGKDCTDAFANYHSAKIYKTWLPPYMIGKCTDVPVYEHVQDFRNIRQELLRRNLFETNPIFYYKLYPWFAALWLTSMYLSIACTSTAAHMIGAAFLGFFWQQVAGLGHDLGHSSVSHNFMHDNWIGSTIGCLMMGVSTGWWKRSHNTHHVVCNSIENDPDIQHMPAIACTEEIMHKPFWSSYHEKVVSVDWCSKFLIRYQHILYFPLMMVARFNLYAQSWILLFTTNNDKYQIMYFRKEEIASMMMYFGWVIAAALQMPTWTEVVAWVIVSHAVCAVLHVQICASHFSRETYHGNAYNGAEDEWYIMQLKTTLDFDCYEWMDFFHIGLQFQIEHHLFPTLPRHNLRLARDMVREVCHKHGIEHYELPFLQAVSETYACLRDTAMAARSGKYDSPTPQMLLDAMNAQG